jgi:hypothetical protein
LSKTNQIKKLAQDGLYYLTEHALHEALLDNFDVYDVEYALMTGTMRRSWPRDQKYEIVADSLDGRPIGIICRITPSNKVRVITVYEDRAR